MSDSLQDQLLALGLAKKKKKAAAKPVHHKGRPPHKPRSPVRKDGGEMSLDKAYALRKRAEQQQQDHARKRKQAEDRQRRQINNEIRPIVKQHRLNDEKAEISRNFLFRERIRKVYVTPEQQKALGTGEIGIVYLSGGYHLLKRDFIEAVRKISADHLVDLGVGEDSDEADFPVPDDLTW